MPESASLLPYTGKEFLASLDDGREVWIYGERVKNIAEHLAFRNTARMIARLYDGLHRDHPEGKNVLDLSDRMGRVYSPLFPGAPLGRGADRRP
jgi:4-hydroxyphenylacetate 3-monooxygenase